MHGMTSGAIEMALRIRGFENYFADMLTNPISAEIMLDKIIDIKIAYWNNALDSVKNNVDVAVEVDELGTQNSLIFI